MFKWPSLPSPRAYPYEIADFAELVCWRDARASAQEVSRALGRLEENDYSEGVLEEDEIDGIIQEGIIQEACGELEQRHSGCQGGYPFQIGRRGSTLKDRQDSTSDKHIIYKYLLLATRLNMDTKRNYAGIDGTKILEDLAAVVAREYFGARAESLVFGTASGTSNFPQRVDHLCGRLGEGGGFQSGRSRSTMTKDGKLDVVAWKPFTDNLPGKLIGFGQCKTGTNYKDTLTQLQPGVFREKWLNSALIVSPIRMFFVSEALPSSAQLRFDISIEAGLTFDRCRIVDFCGTVEPELLTRVKEWTSAAAAANDLPANW